MTRPQAANGPGFGSRLPMGLDAQTLARLGSLLRIGAPPILVSLLATFTLFVVGYDQGHLLETTFRVDAIGLNRMHEFFHDLRHVAGFMCH